MLTTLVALIIVGQAVDVSSDPCATLGTQEQQLACVFTRAEDEDDRAEQLYERVVARLTPVSPSNGFDLLEELDTSRVEWMQYADGACAVVAQRAGPRESFEGYYVFFECRRRFNLDRSQYLWREYDLADEGPEPEALSPPSVDQLRDALQRR